MAAVTVGGREEAGGRGCCEPPGMGAAPSARGVLLTTELSLQPLLL